MNIPLRFTVCSYNIWTYTRWQEREPALRSFIKYFMPDILCLQEIQPDSRATLDDLLLATHQRVNDPFEGWQRESNIYWNRSLFELVEYGAEHIETYEKYRRLFWVRLRTTDGGMAGQQFFVATAHFTWDGNPNEAETGLNPRLAQARFTAEHIIRLVKLGETLLFMGDLNDSRHPIRILQEVGLVDCFQALGTLPPVTFPATPTAKFPASTIDWLMHRGALRVMNAQVVDFYRGDIAPSDHKPVIATYEATATAKKL